MPKNIQISVAMMQVSCLLSSIKSLKLSDQLVVPSIIGKSNMSIFSTNQSQTADSPTASKNAFSVKSPSHPAESIWKCPCCTKEHPAQTASCSLCHGINPNYKKPSGKFRILVNE